MLIQSQAQSAPPRLDHGDTNGTLSLHSVGTPSARTPPCCKEDDPSKSTIVPRLAPSSSSLHTPDPVPVSAAIQLPGRRQANRRHNKPSISRPNVRVSRCRVLSKMGTRRQPGRRLRVLNVSAESKR